MSCSAKDKIPVIDIPSITVNEIEIDKDKLSQIIQYYPASSIDEAIQQGAQTLTIQTLLSQISNLPIDDEQKIMDFVNNQISFDEVTNDDCYRFFKNNKEKFQTSPLLIIRHILLIASYKDIEKRLEQQTLAKK